MIGFAFAFTRIADHGSDTKEKALSPIKTKGLWNCKATTEPVRWRIAALGATLGVLK
jgi:hypothetical protein